MRVACEHDRYDAHGVRPAKKNPKPTRCPGGHEATDAELIAEVKRRGLAMAEPGPETKACCNCHLYLKQTSSTFECPHHGTVQGEKGSS